jgi:hypothetical protein
VKRRDFVYAGFGDAAFRTEKAAHRSIVLAIIAQLPIKMQCMKIETPSDNLKTCARKEIPSTGIFQNSQRECAICRV